MFETIYEQLQTSCDCIRQSDKNDDSFKKNVMQLVDLISSITCWKNSSCETFLSSDREEVFDVDFIRSCHCDGGLMITNLYYKEIKSETIQIILQTRDGIHFEEIELADEDFSFNAYENKLYIDLSPYGINDICSCKKLHKIIVRYTAGYELLPQCLVPVFCDYLQHLIAYNQCDCNCDTCKDETENKAPVEPDTIEEYIQRTLLIAYQRQLETISLCGRSYRFLGMVV